LKPWTVWQSCDGVGFGTPGDGVDRWIDYGDLVWAAGTPRSWIVLRAAGLNTKTALCIDLASGSPNYASIVLSPSAGFGLANGGTDGTLGAAPTATDGVSISYDSQWGGTTGVGVWIHAFLSTDGECTRVVLGQANTVCGFWLIDRPKNPVAHWTTPVVGCVLGYAGAVNMTTRPRLTDDGYSPFRTRLGSLYSSLTATYERTDSYIIQAIPVPDEISGEWPLLGVGLLARTPGCRGRKGELYDLWWGNDYRVTGDMYPGDGSRQFTTIRDLVIPWDGASILKMY